MKTKNNHSRISEADKSCVQWTTYVLGMLYLITVFTFKALATVM